MTNQAAQSTEFSVSPTAGHALGLFQKAFEKILVHCASEATNKGLTCSDRQAQEFEARLHVAMTYFEPSLKDIFSWLFRSQEGSNFTYAINQTNKNYLAAFVAVIARTSPERVHQYIAELDQDSEIRKHISTLVNQPGVYMGIDPQFDFGRRLGWYAIARAMKPRVIVETGVEQGLGSVVLASALLRNAAEGAPGVYIGTDINPQAGYLLQGKYSEVGKIVYGDSIESLKSLNQRIDLFINDSDHSAEYEAREYDTIRSMLTDHAIVLGDNAHSSESLYQFASRTGRKFLFFPERPESHWYPGAGIGCAFT